MLELQIADLEYFKTTFIFYSFYLFELNLALDI